MANDALRAVFPSEGVASGDPVTLMRTLEAALDAGKDAWPLAAIRALWETLFAGQAARATSQAHEGRWLNLCGFLLRPCFGHALDDWRMQQLWKLYSQGLRFPRATQCRVEWWGLWKRVAGGLSRPQQIELFNQTAPYLLPRLKARKDRRSDVGPQEAREYWQLLASCEQLAPATKVELGAALLPLVVKSKASEAEIWALGRLGARALFAGPLNCVLPRQTAEEWVAALLDRPEWSRPGPTSFALVQLARCVGDRERDLDDGLRHRLAARLRSMPHGERAARLVSEPIPLGEPGARASSTNRSPSACTSATNRRRRGRSHRPPCRWRATRQSTRTVIASRSAALRAAPARSRCYPSRGNSRVQRRVHRFDQLVDRDAAVEVGVERQAIGDRTQAERDVDAEHQLVDRHHAVAVAIARQQRLDEDLAVVARDGNVLSLCVDGTCSVRRRPVGTCRDRWSSGWRRGSCTTSNCRESAARRPDL